MNGAVHHQTRAPIGENSPAKSLKEDKKEFYLRMTKEQDDFMV